MSPYCQGLLLANCQSSGAHDLRAEIRAASKGETRHDIVDDLAKRYGASIRPEPTMDGVGALAWVLPGALAIASFLLLTRWLRNSASRVDVPERGEATTIEEDPLIARVDQELLAVD